MRRVAAVFIILAAVTTGAFAVDFTTFQTSFETFAQDVANVLPFNASTGLNWSPAYVGQFPHFGVGLTAGATTIPASAIDSILASMGMSSLPSEFATYGVPVPAYTVDARIGGFGLPFDIGLKLGYIPPGTLQKLGVSGVDVNYILAGADVRFAVLKDQGFLPALSLGLGYNYMQGNVGVSGLLGSNIALGNFTDPRDSSTHTLSLSDPALQMQWQTNVVEAKVQLSKKLLFITPYVGAAASYSFGSTAGGGVASTLYYDGSPMTQTQIDDINQYYASQGLTSPYDLSTTGVTVTTASPAGFSYRAFGGLSLNIFFIYFDLGAAYNISSGSLGGSLNVRLAL